MDWKISVYGIFWQASCGERIIMGSKEKIEDFLDNQETIRERKIRKRRAKKRLSKLISWLYNHKK